MRIRAPGELHGGTFRLSFLAIERFVVPLHGKKSNKLQDLLLGEQFCTTHQKRSVRPFSGAIFFVTRPMIMSSDLLLFDPSVK